VGEGRHHPEGVDEALDALAHVPQPLGGKLELGPDACAFARGVWNWFPSGHLICAFRLLSCASCQPA
jgi:hypothetical protein